MRKMPQFFLYMLIVLITVGCTMQRDLYVKATSMLLILTDWKNATVEPEIWTVVFYNGNQQALSLIDKKDSISIHQGNYEALAVNGTLSNGIDYVRFRGADKFDTFEAYATAKTQNLIFNDYAVDAIINNPDTLYGTSVYKEIAGDNNYYIKYRDGRNGFFVPNLHMGDTIEFIPERLTYKVNIVATLHSFENAAKNTYIVGNLKGFAPSVFVGTGLPSHLEVFQEFSFRCSTQRTTTFETTTSYNSFGPPIDLNAGERAYLVRLKMVLRDGSIYDKLFDVRNQVEVIITKIKQEHIKEFTIYISDTLPEVKDSGSDVGVAPWEDDIHYPFPVN